jgi:hypothetical protein
MVELPHIKKETDENKIHDDIDDALRNIMNKDKIQLVNEVIVHPPLNDYMKEEVPPGVYALDLRTALNAQLSDRPASVNPMIVDHACRAAVNRRDAYKSEKRKLPFQYWWLLLLLIGGGVILLFVMMLLPDIMKNFHL